MIALLAIGSVAAAMSIGISVGALLRGKSYYLAGRAEHREAVRVRESAMHHYLAASKLYQEARSVNDEAILALGTKVVERARP